MEWIDSAASLRVMKHLSKWMLWKKNPTIKPLLEKSKHWSSGVSMRKYSVRYLGCIPPKMQCPCPFSTASNNVWVSDNSGLKLNSFTAGCCHHAADGRTASSYYDVFMFIIDPSSIIECLDVYTAVRPCLGKCQAFITQTSSEVCLSSNVVLITRELQLVQAVHNFPPDARIITPCNSTVQVLCLPREHKLIEQHYY